MAQQSPPPSAIRTTSNELPLPSPAPAGPVAWALRHPYTIATITTLTVMSIGLVAKKHSAWDEVSYDTARMLRHGVDFYKERISYTYPPFTAWFTIPFSWLPLRVGRAVWCIACVLSLVWLVRASWRLAGGGGLEPDERTGAPAAGPRDQIAFLLGHACALQFALNALTHLQSDLLIGALLMVGCAALVAGQSVRGAAWIGLAAAFKATPLLFLPYLLWRRRWAAAAVLVVVAVGANLLPDTVHRPPGGGTWLGAWYRQYLKPIGDPSRLPGDWKNQLVNNQSLAGAANRWLTTSWDPNPKNFRVFERERHPPATVVNAAYLGMCAAMVLPIGWALWRRRRWPAVAVQTQDVEGGTELTSHGERLPGATPIECGLVFLLMLLASPNSSRAHFAIMFLPAFCLARLAVRPVGERPYIVAMRVLLALAAISSTLSIHIRIPGTYVGEQLMLWIGVVTFAAVFLLLGGAAALAGTRVPILDAPPAAAR